MSISTTFNSLRAESLSRHGLAIATLKAQVGDGCEYANEVARAVLSDTGGYFQLREMPEEFAGAVGAGVTVRHLSGEQAQAMPEQLQHLAQTVSAPGNSLQRLSLYAVYAGGSLRRRRGLFVLDYRAEQDVLTHGSLRADVPRFWKAALHAPERVSPSCEACVDAFGLPASGIQFFLAHKDGGVLVTFARVPGAQDLGQGLSSASSVPC